MDEMLSRFWNDLVGRITGPMSFRLILQPAVATFLAVRAGIRDARSGRPLYTWSLLTDAGHRIDFLKLGLRDVGKVFVVAVVLDFVYQWIAFRWIYPNESLVVAFILAIVPYVLIRGPVNRLIRSRRRATERVVE